MDKKALILKIKGGGYWEVNIRPVVYPETKLTHPRLKSLTQESVVTLRGWDYPHYRDRNGEPVNIQNGIEKYTDFDDIGAYELWRMTMSGNFYHIFGLTEDHFDRAYDSYYTRGESAKDKRVLSVWGTLYTLTEIFEFARRLALKDLFGKQIYIDVSLHSIQDRELIVDNSQKIPFSYSRKSVEYSWSNKQKIYQTKNFINSSSDISFEAFIDLMALFQWDNPPISNLKDDQLKFLKVPATTEQIPEITLQINGQANKNNLELGFVNQSGRNLVIESIEVDGAKTIFNQQFLKLFKPGSIETPTGIFDEPRDAVSIRVIYRTLDNRIYELTQKGIQESRADGRFNIIFPSPSSIKAI